MSQDLFTPPGVHFRPVQPQLANARHVVNILTTFPFVVGAVLLAVLLSPWWWILVAVVVIEFAWSALLISRQVPAMGYAERDEDLLIRKGIMWKTLTVVPYGRMQFVDVSVGPLQRKLGIATVQLHTASASTDATIPGLTPAEAERLRDRLAERGQAKLAGL
ncbi:MAG: PH domain-containing protein [Promicromonosporaceae bacterium]|nr:PH domain-containing protein [Promicromonosporaceae bacterium]